MELSKRQRLGSDFGGNSNRFSGLSKPAIAFSLKANKTSNTQGLKHGGKDVGKLEGLLDFPVDVFYEIASQLEPLDIVNLSRVSVYFRSVFMSRSSRCVWRTAIQNVASLPSCPPDINEPQYAVLLFDRVCMACGNQRASCVDYGLRLRFCKPCNAINVARGSTLLKPFGKKLPRVIFSLFPRATHNGIIDSRSNHSTHTYYKPELETVIRKYLSIQNNQNALDTFIAERQAIATSMMEHGQSVKRWVESVKREKIRQREKIKEMREDFAKKLEEEYYRIILHRHATISTQLGMPRWEDMLSGPILTNLVVKKYDQIDRAAELLDSVFQALVDEASGPRNLLEKNLVDILQGSLPEWMWEEDTAHNILLRATSLFRCDTCGPCHPLLMDYRAVLDHWHLEHNHSQHKWPSSAVHCEPEYPEMALMLLEALGLPGKAPRAAIESMDGRLLCSCNDPQFHSPTTFNNLVLHLVQENRWYASRMRSLKQRIFPSRWIVHNDHDISSQPPCIKLLPANSDQISMHTEEESDYGRPLYSPISMDSMKFCVICYCLGGFFKTFTSEEKVKRHMKAKHLQEVVDEETVDSVENRLNYIHQSRK